MPASPDRATEAAPALAATLARLVALDPSLAADIRRPTGRSWHRLDRVTVDGHLKGWVDELAARHQGQRDVAGSYLGSWLTQSVIRVFVAALVLERRAPDLADPPWVHRHPDGWVDRVAFETPGVAVLAGDPDARSADATVHDDWRSLSERCATLLVEAVGPALTAIRSLTPFGLRGLWGSVADDLAAMALSTARLTGSDQRAAWQAATDLTDAIALHVPHLRTRPQAVSISWSGGEALFSIKGTCCLYYKTQDQPAEIRGDSHCTTCPLRDDQDRQYRLRDHLERLGADTSPS